VTYTQEEKDRFLTLIFDPSPVKAAADKAAVVLWRYAERVGGLDPAEDVLPPGFDRGAWPLRARLVDWLADRLDDAGLWANSRRAKRRRS
jgi:hypothetical protein